jgi:hypothetical protein
MRTSLYTVLCIVIRLGAVMLAVEAILAVPAAWYMTGSTDLAPGWHGALIAFGIATLAFAALLWVYPGVLARIAAGASSRQVFESPLSGEELQQIALCVLGVWLAIDGIVEFVNLGVRLIVTAHVDTNVPFVEMARRDVGRIVSVLVKVGLGVALSLGARGLVGLLRRVRHQGLPPVDAGGEASR